MLGWLLTIVGVAACLFLLPPLLERMPRGKGGGAGPALSELNAIFNPAERQVIAARQKGAVERTPSADPPETTTDDPDR